MLNPRAVLTLTLGALEAPGAQRPTTDSAAVALKEVRVAFDDGGVRLAGMLVLPRGDGPHPGVVLVHGSGPDDGASYAHYARAFAAAGIAALVYDKRGFGGSGGDWRRRSVDALAGDALAGADALRARRDIRAQQVGLWGISQGGWVVARATARDRRVAFAVVIAGGGVSPTQQEMYHKDEIFRHLGYSLRAREAALRVWRMIFDGLVLYARGRVPIPAGVMEGELAASHFGLDYDPVPDWHRVAERGRQPVLAVFGEEDRLTPVPETAARLRAAFAANAAHDIDVRVFRGAGHTITTHQTGLRFDWDSAFARGYLATVTGWIRTRTGDSVSTAVAGMRADSRTSPDFADTGRYGRLPWYGRIYPQLLSFVAFLVVFAGVCLGATARSVRALVPRRSPRTNRSPTAELPLTVRPLRRLAVVVAVIDLVLLLGFVAFVRAAVFPQGMGWVESYAIPARFRLLPIVGVIAALLTVGLLVASAKAWRGAARSHARSIGHFVVMIAAIAFIPWLAYWRLIGPGF